MRQKVLEYNAIFQKENEGGYSVWIPSLSGCASQGETFEEALENIKGAIELYLEDEPQEEKEQNFDTRSQFMVPISLNINA